MSHPHVCQYCGLTTEPLAFHEGSADCQAAMRAFTTRLREVLPVIQPFISCWEFDRWNLEIDGEEIYKEISLRVGHGIEFKDMELHLEDPKAAQQALIDKLKERM